MFLTKGITFLIQAALVVAGVLAFSFFDPFNIFNTKKLRMTDTSLILESTQSIGELITAEFYGEVLVGSKESYEVNYENLVDSLRESVEKVHTDFKAATEDIKPGLVPNWKRIYDRFEDDNSVLFRKANFQEYWEILRTRTEQDEQHKVLKKIRKDQDWWSKSPESIAKEYVEMRYSVDETKKKRNRQRLVMLGRGWVRAGIDFTNFTENAFSYDRDKGIIKLYGNQPKILSASINPWLSPEEGIPGWEIVEVNGKARRKGGPELVKEVKTTGLSKLKRRAEAAGILDKAVKNAEVNLSGFFSLVLDEEITVRIYANTLEAYLGELGKDLDREEVIAASDIIRTHLKEVPEVFDFHKAVSKRKFNFPDTFGLDALPLHYQAFALRLTKNDILDETDRTQLDSLKMQPPNTEDLFYLLAADTNLHKPANDVLTFWTWDDLFQWYLRPNQVAPDEVQVIENWKLIKDYRDSLNLQVVRNRWRQRLDTIISKQAPALPTS